MSQLVGNYKSVPISMQDIDVFQSLSPELKKASGDCGPFTIKKVWSQVVKGVNRFYHVMSESGKKYSARIYYPLPSAEEMPSLTLFMKGWVSPNGRKLTFNSDDELILNAARKLTKLGAFKEHAPTSSDRDLVRKFTPEILHALGEHMLCAKQNIQITAAWEQVVAGRNEFYHLKVNGKMRCSVNIFVPLGEEQSQMTFFTKGLINPTTVPEIDPTKDVLSLIVIPDYIEKSIEHSDVQLVKLHTLELRINSLQLKATFTIDKAWVQHFQDLKNFYYYLTSSSKSEYSTIISVSSNGESLVRHFFRGHKDPTKLHFPDYKTELKSRLTLGGYAKLKPSQEDDERVKKLTNKLNELIKSDNVYTVDQAWIKTSPSKSNYYYILKGKNESQYYSANIKSVGEQEQVTHFVSKIVLPSFHTDGDATDGDEETVIIGYSEESGEKKGSPISIAANPGEFVQVIPVPQEDQRIVDVLINPILGNLDHYQIVREWRQVVAGMVKYCWVEGSRKDKYSVSIFYPLSRAQPQIMYILPGFIPPNSTRNSNALESLEVIPFEGIIPVPTTDEDRLLVDKHTPQMIKLSGEPEGTTFNIILTAVSSLIGAVNKWYQLISSNKKNYTVGIVVSLQGGSSINHFYKDHLPFPGPKENSDHVTVQKKDFINLLFGSYDKKTVSLYDYELIRKHTEDLRAMTSETDPVFFINAVWAQVINGQLRYYWLTSQHNQKYSVIIYVPPVGTLKKSSVFSFDSGHIDPNPILNSNSSENQKTGEYVAHPVNSHDKQLVEFHTKQMLRLLRGKQSESFSILIAKRQIVNGYNNKYVLKGRSSKMNFQAIIYESFDKNVEKSRLTSIRSLILTNTPNNQDDVIPGQYKPSSITPHDQSLVSSHYKEMVFKSGDLGYFQILSAEILFVNGVSHKYVLSSFSTKSRFQAIIYESPQSQKSQMTYFERILYQNSDDGVQNKTTNESGEYIPHKPTRHDEQLVKKHYYEMVVLSPGDKGGYQIRFAEKQIVNGINNRYLLQSESTGHKYLAIIYENLSGNHSIMTLFVRVQVNGKQSKVSNQQDDYVPHTPTLHDQQLVNRHTPEMIKLSDGDFGLYIVLTAQDFKQFGTTNRYILRSLSTRRMYRAVIHQLPIFGAQKSSLLSFEQIFPLKKEEVQTNKVSNQQGEYVPRSPNLLDQQLVNLHTPEMVIRSGGDVGLYGVLTAEDQNVDGVNHRYIVESHTTHRVYIAVIYQPRILKSQKTTLVSFEQIFTLKREDPQQNKVQRETGEYRPHFVNDHDKKLVTDHYVEMVIRSPGDKGEYKIIEASSQLVDGVNYRYILLSASTAHIYQAIIFEPFDESKSFMPTFKRINLKSSANGQQLNLSNPEYVASPGSKDKSSLQIIEVQEEVSYVPKTITVLDVMLVESHTQALRERSKQPSAIFTIDQAWQKQTLGATHYFYWISDQYKHEFSVEFVVQSDRHKTTKIIAFYPGHVDPNKQSKSESTIQSNNIQDFSQMDNLIVTTRTPQMNKGAPQPYFNTFQINSVSSRQFRLVNAHQISYKFTYKVTARYSSKHYIAVISGNITSRLDSIIRDQITNLAENSVKEPLLGAITWRSTTPDDYSAIDHQLTKINQFTRKQNDRYTILSTWGIPNSSLNTCYWLTDNSGSVFSLYMKTDRTVQSNLMFDKMKYGLTKPFKSFVLFDGQLPVSGKYGGYQLQEVSRQTEEVISIIKKELMEKTGMKDVQLNILCEWKQTVNGTNNFFWVECDRQYCSINIFTPPEKFHLPQVTYFEKMIVSPVDGTEHLLSSTGLFRNYGAFTFHLVKGDDKQLVSKMTPLLKSITDVESFKILAAWSQVVSGINNFYWILGKNNMLYSINFYTPFGMDYINTDITYFAEGLKTPTAGTDQIVLGSSPIGGYQIHELKHKDLELVDFVTPEIRTLSGEQDSFYLPVAGWRQILPQGTNNEYYWVKSSTLKQYSVIVVRTDGLSPIVSECKNGFVYPNKQHILTEQYKTKYGGETWQPLTMQDIEFLRKHNKEINEKSGEKEAIFVPMSLWVQAVNPPQRTYWLTTLSGKAYTTIFSGDEITSCNHGLILPGVPPQYSASMNLKQLYYPVPHTQGDNVLIKSYEKDLQQASGEQGDVTFKIDMMWSQMEMTFELNKFYWLTSSSGKKYSANISFIAPLMRYSDMTKFTEHWVNPNLI